jgi:hypothetical protein
MRQITESAKKKQLPGLGHLRPTAMVALTMEKIEWMSAGLERIKLLMHRTEIIAHELS